MACNGGDCPVKASEYTSSTTVEGVTTEPWLFTPGDNSSNRTEEDDSRDENLAKWEIFVSSVILVVALFGNSIVVHSLWRRRKKLSRMHFFILHLCVADLLTCLLSIFPQLVWDISYLFYAPDVICRIVKYGQVFPMYLSTYILVMTAIDRYIAICHPLLGLRGDYTQRMRIMIAVAYGLSFLYAIPQIVIFRNVAVEGGYQCWAVMKYSTWSPRAYITFFVLAVYVIPSTILGITYGLVCYTVWRNMGKTPDSDRHKIKNGGHHSSNVATTNLDEDEGDTDGAEVKVSKSTSEREDPLCRKHGSAARVSRAKVKTIKMTLTIVTVYVACWTPFSLAQLWNVWHPPSAPFHGDAFTIIMLLANLNSCTNPLIYLAFSGNVKRETLETFGCFKFLRATSGHFSKSKYANDRTHMEDNSSRYASSTSHVGSKTLYSSLDTTGREGPIAGYACNFGSSAAQTRDI
nr:oxytocin receptor-like [Lytechinus pictus]